MLVLCDVPVPGDDVNIGDDIFAENSLVSLDKYSS